MTFTAVGYAANGGIAGAGTIIGWDGGLAAVLAAAYICCRGWTAVPRLRGATAISTPVDGARPQDSGAAGGDIGADHDPHGAGGEPRQIALANVLRQVPAQVGGGCATRGQMPHELMGRVLGAGEDQRPVTAPGEGGDHADPVAGDDGEQVVHNPGRHFSGAGGGFGGWFMKRRARTSRRCRAAFRVVSRRAGNAVAPLGDLAMRDARSTSTRPVLRHGSS